MPFELHNKELACGNCHAPFRMSLHTESSILMKSNGIEIDEPVQQEVICDNCSSSHGSPITAFAEMRKLMRS